MKTAVEGLVVDCWMVLCDKINSVSTELQYRLYSVFNFMCQPPAILAFRHCSLKELQTLLSILLFFYPTIPPHPLRHLRSALGRLLRASSFDDEPLPDETTTSSSSRRPPSSSLAGQLQSAARRSTTPPETASPKDTIEESNRARKQRPLSIPPLKDLHFFLLYTLSIPSEVSDQPCWVEVSVREQESQ